MIKITKEAIFAQAATTNTLLVCKLTIDGDHTSRGLVADFDNYSPKLRSGGVVVFDDYNEWDDVKPAIKELNKSGWCDLGPLDNECGTLYVMQKK